MHKPSKIFICFLFLAGSIASSRLCYSAALPKSTTETLQKLKIDPALLSDIDKELQVPQQWIEGAKKEGKLVIRGTAGYAGLANAIYAPFRERYPFINLEYSATNTEDRVLKTLLAYKSGRIIGDIVESLAGHQRNFKEANALEDIRSIPALKNVISEAKDPEGLWIADGLNVYCMAYNTKLVQAKDLPKVWEDLLANPAWRDGKLAVPNRPESWAVSLWKAKGERWTKEFLTKLFAEVKPQLRKEGQNAMIPLLTVGEFHAVVPASNKRTYQGALEGAPVDFTCPEPAPLLLSDMVAVKGSPNSHAAKLYLNWILTKEGQISRQINNAGMPVHNQLQRKEFVPFGDRIAGKQKVFQNIADEETIMPELSPFWNNLWLRGGRK